MATSSSSHHRPMTTSYARPPGPRPASNQTSTVPNTSAITTAISNHLTSLHLPPNRQWLHSALASTTNPTRPNPTPSLPSLQEIVLARLLASDFTASLQPTQPTSLLPREISNAEVKERRLPGPIAVQVLDIEDLGRSRWSQVESLQAEARSTGGRGEVIHALPEEADGNGNATATPAAAVGGGKSLGPHKLLLQDAAGAKCYALELVGVQGVGVQMGIGAKLVLRDVVCARGVMLLEPRGVEVLGGRVEVWDAKWKAERREVLTRKAGMRDGPAG